MHMTRKTRRGGSIGAIALIATMLSLTITTATGAVTRDELEQELIELTNEHRISVGCDPLTPEPRLAQTARDHSIDMAVHNYFDHTDRMGRSPFDRMAATGYQRRTAGENLAAGRWRPADALRQWLDSPPHRANIENCSFTQIGVGLGATSHSYYTYYWTQLLAAPK